jgi:formate C-acetyltransferase
LKRAIVPFGGIRVVKAGLEAYGYQLDRQTEEIFTKYRKTHNDGVFDVYTRSMRLARRSGIITGLPDAYGRGPIVGDYRRVALYGVDRLIDDKKTQQESLEQEAMDEATIRLREELSEQIRALFELKEMAASYGFDIGRPAANALLSCPVGVFWLLGSSERTKRGSDVSRARIDVFRHLFRARFASRREFRTRIARTDRPFCNETPHGAVFANSRL